MRVTDGGQRTNLNLCVLYWIDKLVHDQGLTGPDSHHAAYCWSSEESAAAALWEQSTADHAVPLQNTKTQ